MPEDYKITLPLMAIQQDGRYLGLTWHEESGVSALFDSPDRILHSGGHLLSLQFPGATLGSRAAGALLPYTTMSLSANKPLTAPLLLMGGKSDSVIPAVQRAVEFVKLPPIPTPYPKWEDAARLMEAGWLDSGDRKDGTFKHALPGSFPYQRAADAGVWLDYLASQTTDKAQAERMSAAAKQALKDIPRSELNSYGVGHVRYPVPALVYGAAAENAEHAAQQGRALLQQFEPDGTIKYHKPTDGRPDLGRTHFAPDANGLTAQVVASVLEAAKFSGDKELIREGLRVLHGLDRFANTVPRGAQTWEVPLHTPDILASAYLARAYTLGYELSGDTKLLDSAKYWAWTGVPFVYLQNPTGQVGPYATIPVLGATQWVAPNWIGLPVQWCGLVYADALRLLAKYDRNPFWTTLADGITASGLAQTFPIGSDKERVGMLPDSFNIVGQVRNDPAINPATLLSGLPALYKRIPIYDACVCRKTGLIIHAPGAIAGVRETAAGLTTFRVEGWPSGAYEVLIVGLTHAPQVFINGKEVPLTAPNRYMEKEGRLILRVTGQPEIRVK